LTVEEVRDLWRQGYQPERYVEANSDLSTALDLVGSGFFCLGDEGRYASVARTLRQHDPYMVCADFASYAAAMRDASEVFRSPREWTRRSLFNIVGASAFSSDATVRAYARDIWGIVPVKADVS
jgi:starch phosphorylase